ncbi:MAG: tyrosine-type recombinase/integrase [Erysipelotrichaceae bacterium]|nr:tyrosine-type recombinase/integrase [Erysipelotrichaceae bacterium]
MSNLKAYEEFLTLGLRYSPYSVRSYLGDVRIFLLYLEEHGLKFNRLNERDLRAYLRVELERGNTRRTIRRKLSALKKYYEYLLEQGAVKENPLLLLPRQKSEIRYPKVLSHEEIAALLIAHQKRDSKEQLRDQLILEVLFGSGLRVSELCALKISDIDFKRRVFRIFGKGLKERMVPFNETEKALLEAYLAKRNSHHEALFLSSRGEALTPRGVQYLLKQIEQVLDLKIPLYPHLFRHSFATELLNNDADLLAVKELLGHESINTTQIYTHVSHKTIKENYLKAHPRSKKK